MTQGKNGKATPPPEIGKVNTKNWDEEEVRSGNLGYNNKTSVEDMLHRMTPEEQEELRQEIDILLNGSNSMRVNFKWLPESVIADGKEIYCKAYSRQSKGDYNTIMEEFEAELSEMTEEEFFLWLDHVESNSGFSYINNSGNRVPIIDVDTEMAMFYFYGRLEPFLYALEEWKLGKTAAENLIKEKIDTWFEKPLSQPKRPDGYRTKRKAADLTEEQGEAAEDTKQQDTEAVTCIADKPKSRVAMITHPDYSGALDFLERGKAHLQQFNTDMEFDFRDGYLFVKAGDKVTTAKLQDLKTKKPITDIDTGILQALYDFWLPAKTENPKVKRLKIYAPDLYEHITGDGCRNINTTTYEKDENGNFIIDEITGEKKIKALGFREAIIEKVVKGFHNVGGIIDVGRREPSIYPPLLFEGYDSETDIFTFTFPYFGYVWDMYNKNPVTYTVTSKTGKTQKEIPKPTHSYLIHSDIEKERNKIAVKNVMLIVDTIERAGGGEKNVHISIATLIEKNRLLNERLLCSNDIGKDLNRIFLKTYDLLRTKTDLKKKYKDIQLPVLKKIKAKDKKNYDRYIPTPKNYKTFVINISHKGINKEYEV